MSSQGSSGKLSWVKVVYTAFIVLFFTCQQSSLYAEKVGKLYYEGFVSEVHDSLVTVPSDLIAMAERINVPTDSSQLFIKSSSIFFIIDNSGSMDGYYSEKNQLIGPMDPMGNRFEVTKAIIDTLTKYPDTYPDIECGLAVFQKDLYYDDSLDDLLDTLVGDTIQGAYIPLLKVDSSYTSGEDGELSTQDIFYKYLKTQKSKFSQNFNDFDTTVTWEAVRLTQPRDPKSKGGTNINTGFKAAIQAMEKAKHGKDNQFIVFISDGISSFGTGDDYESGAINGKEFMTTFTVYFTHNDSTPESLVTMNEAIKNNGYSGSNQKYTQLWEYKNNSKEELVDFFMENIVKVFEGTSKSKPKKFKLKDSGIGAIWDDKNDQFILDALIPFTGDTTKVEYEITLETSYDTLDEKGEIVTIIEDTTLQIANNYWRKDKTTPIPEKFSATYWDRNIVFRYKGTDVTALTETMQELDLVFTNDPLESGYTYTNCTFDIKALSSGDSESFTLSKVGAQEFAHTIELKRVLSGANSGNGVLEHKDSDTFVVTFRNSEPFPLPLDTLVADISMTLSTTLSIEEATYFDIDANGFIDSVALLFNTNDAILESNREEIVSLLQFPQRDLDILSSSCSNNLIALRVDEKSSTPQTAVKDGDRVKTVEEVILKGGGRFLQQDVAITDSLAPIVLSANLRDNPDEDTLEVEFSEPIDTILSTSPFYFYATKDNDTQYNVACSFLDLSQQETTAKFSISDYVDRGIETGDSMHIHIGDKVSDKNYMFQNNARNRKCEIRTLTSIQVTNAAYFDVDANGFIDSITLSLSEEDEQLEQYLEELIAQIELPSLRSFTVHSSSLSAGKISLRVSEGNDTPQTSVNGSEKVSITNTISLGASFIFLPQQISIDDSLAPVIVSANLEAYPLSKKDTLTIKFSESINEPLDSEPFRFYVKGTSEEIALSCAIISRFDDNTKALCIIDTYMGDKFIEEGDSVHIDWRDKIADSYGTIQANKMNIKRAISVDEHRTEVHIQKATYFDRSADGKVDKIVIECSDSLENRESDSLKKILFNAIEDIKIRDFTADSITQQGSVYSVYVSEKWDQTNSAIMGSDEVCVPHSYALGKCLSFPACSISIVDSVAPVIVSAHFTDSLKVDAQDVLEVIFSEPCHPIGLDQQRPFRFFSNDKEYVVSLSFINESSEVSSQYEVTQVTGDNTQKIMGGDSISIDEKKEISDLWENVQDNPENIRREISVERIMSPVEIELKATVITSDEEQMYIQLEIGSVEDLPKGAELTARGQLFDAVGNTVTSPFEIPYDHESASALYVWDGSNKMGRKVGAGSLFLLVDNITLTLESAGYSSKVALGKRSLTVFVQR